MDVMERGCVHERSQAVLGTKARTTTRAPPLHRDGKVFPTQVYSTSNSVLYMILVVTPGRRCHGCKRSRRSDAPETCSTSDRYGHASLLHDRALCHFSPLHAFLDRPGRRKRPN